MMIRCIVAVAMLSVSTAVADVVTLKNGDKLTGKVGQVAGGKMTFSSPVLGDITIDMANVETFVTDEPATLRMKGGAPTVTDKITAASTTQYTTAGGSTVPVADVKIFNPPPMKWTGSILVNGALVRGNTETLDIGVSILAALRRITDANDDRFTLGGAYNLGTNGTGDNSTTVTDNWNAFGKYDRFWTEKLYGYVGLKAEHDRIADLNYRIAPGIGVGYQWIESPDFNFNTEAGISYVYEEFDSGDTNDYIGLRLAYHLDKKLVENVSMFHNLEYLPAFEDPGGNFLLTVDAGIRAMMTKSFFTELKAEWKHDSTPAEDRLKNDMRYIIGVGWLF